MSNNNLNVQSINLTGVQGAVANLPTLQSIQVCIIVCLFKVAAK